MAWMEESDGVSKGEEPKSLGKACRSGLKKERENGKLEKSLQKQLAEKSLKGKNYCIVCEVQYSDKSEFEAHARSHKKVPCMICDKVCLTGLRLLSHVRNVHSNRPKNIPCDQCSKMFATSNSLWVHKKTLHKTKWELTCSKCGYGTNSKEMFEEHLQKAGENHSTFKCDACDKEYASQQNLDKHVQLYHVDHTCKYCNKEYGSRNNLLRHIQRSHGKQKSRDIPCGQCSKMFYTKWQLKVHMNLHINKKHQCSYCEYSTVYPQALKTHVKIHTKQYNCICDWCGKGFMNKSALKNHMAREHLGVVVSCSVCQKKFHAQKYLDLHMECHQPGYEMRNHQCEICGRRFLRRPMLRRHIRAHKGLTRTYKCPYCDKVLTSSSSLKDHINIHTGQRPYVCEICGNGFARKNYLTAHLRTHTKEKPFCCEECGSAFSQRGTLTMHLKKHREQQILFCRGLARGRTENTWNDAQSGQEATWINLNKLEENIGEEILAESLEEPQSNGAAAEESKEGAGAVEKVKSNKKNKTGRRINRPAEYNYPQKCEFCGQVFLEKEMVRHKKVHPESFTLDCIPCGKFFNSKAAYDTHYNIHKIYHCVSCKKDFNARKHYRSHMERIHKSEGERPRIHECDICQKTFKDKFVLNTHKKTHFNIKAHKCPMCDYACNNLTYMRQHVMNHTNQLQFKCHICYRGFMTDAELQVHVDKLHSNEPQIYSCDVCGKISTSKGNLRQHQKIHNPEHNQKKDHQCFECGKTFALKCRLKKHVLSHKGQDKCHCSVCGKLLSKDSYKKHLKAHSGEKPFLCDYCGEAFTTNSCLMGHRRTHTGEKPTKPFSCDQCGKSFAQQSVFLSHKRTHAESAVRGFCCEECGKSFTQASLFASHKKVHAMDNTYGCDLCGKGFADHNQLLDHRNTYHVPERSYGFIGFTSQPGLQETKDAKMFGQW